MPQTRTNDEHPRTSHEGILCRHEGELWTAHYRHPLKKPAGNAWATLTPENRRPQEDLLRSYIKPPSHTLFLVKSIPTVRNGKQQFTARIRGFRSGEKLALITLLDEQRDPVFAMRNGALGISWLLSRRSRGLSYTLSPRSGGISCVCDNNVLPATNLVLSQCIPSHGGDW